MFSNTYLLFHNWMFFSCKICFFEDILLIQLFQRRINCTSAWLPSCTLTAIIESCVELNAIHIAQLLLLYFKILCCFLMFRGGGSWNIHPFILLAWVLSNLSLNVTFPGRNFSKLSSQIGLSIPLIYCYSNISHS